jgi:integrase
MVAMCRAALGVSDYPLAPAIMLWGGARSEEVRGLQARDLRPRRMQVRVERAVVESYGISLETTKSTQTRFVRLPAGLVVMLEGDLAARGLAGDDQLSPRHSGRAPHLMYGYELINRSWVPAREAAGVSADPGAEAPGRRELPTPHDARATHASWLHALGWGDLEAMAQLGHSTIVLTKNLYAEAQSTDREHDADAARLARDPDLSPGRKLDLL